MTLKRCRHFNLRIRLLPPLAQLGLMTEMEISARCPLCHRRSFEVVSPNAFQKNGVTKEGVSK